MTATQKPLARHVGRIFSPKTFAIVGYPTNAVPFQQNGEGAHPDLPVMSSSPDTVVMGARSIYRYVGLRVHMYAEEPPLDLDPWEEVAELTETFTERDGRLETLEWFDPDEGGMDPDLARFELPLGTYRFRVSARGRDAVADYQDHSNEPAPGLSEPTLDYELLREQFEIDIWPTASTQAPRRLRP